MPLTDYPHAEERLRARLEARTTPIQLSFRHLRHFFTSSFAGVREERRRESPVWCRPPARGRPTDFCPRIAPLNHRGYGPI
jgi:hypothetical protein